MNIKPDYGLEKFGISADDIKSEVEHLAAQAKRNHAKNNLFTRKSASEWMLEASTRPVPRMLFAELWFEGELCILFADTNLGKSILAVQVANSISNGVPIPGFQLQTEAQVMLYFDFELSDKQFENRYSAGFEAHYPFHSHFQRIEINADAELPEGLSFEEFLSDSLEHSIKETGAKVLIIDNLTYLKNETEKAKDALPLMKQLKALKSRYGLSILALAHTPKRDPSKPITRNDLQGSKMLINFCDSAFAIGESYKDPSLRYIKQIKQRNTEQIYDAENVCICQINKPFNFLQFELLGHATEEEHLRQLSEVDKEKLKGKVLELHCKGLSLREIGAKLNITHTKVNRIIKNHA